MSLHNYLFDNICFFCNIDSSELTANSASFQIVVVNYLKLGFSKQT
jgi:hypothetical protein